jgi:hypothetical protein
MATTNEINYADKREQAMLAVIDQLDLRDNDHGLKDVIDVLAEFWNTAVKLTESEDGSSIVERPRTTVLPVMIVESKDIVVVAAARRTQEEIQGVTTTTDQPKTEEAIYERLKKKYRIYDIAYEQFEGHTREYRPNINQYVISTQAVKEGISLAWCAATLAAIKKFKPLFEDAIKEIKEKEVWTAHDIARVILLQSVRDTAFVSEPLPPKIKEFFEALSKIPPTRDV